jgi:hypothetical protein
MNRTPINGLMKSSLFPELIPTLEPAPLHVTTPAPGHLERGTRHGESIDTDDSVIVQEIHLKGTAHGGDDAQRAITDLPLNQRHRLIVLLENTGSAAIPSCRHVR